MNTLTSPTLVSTFCCLKVTIALWFQSLTVRDTVRECLEKDPSERSEDDVETLLEFTQHLKAFTNMTLAVRRALCSVMVSAAQSAFIRRRQSIFEQNVGNLQILFLSPY